MFHPFSRVAAPLLLPLAELCALCSGRLPIYLRLPAPSIVPGLCEVHFTMQSILKQTRAFSSLLGRTWTGWDSWEPGRNGCTEGRVKSGVKGQREARRAPCPRHGSARGCPVRLQRHLEGQSNVTGRVPASREVAETGRDAIRLWTQLSGWISVLRGSQSPDL